MATKEIAALQSRLNKIEDQKKEEVLTLIEILSNVAFFGDMKKAKCQYAKDGQCSYFTLKKTKKNTLPIITDCKIKGCKEPCPHYHINISDITCCLCHLEQ